MFKGGLQTGGMRRPLREVRCPGVHTPRSQDSRTYFLPPPQILWIVALFLEIVEMKLLLIVFLLILILGPLRRAFFRSWRFNVPAVLAGIAAWVVVSNAMKAHDPWWMPHAVAALVALGAGAAVKQWLDEIFGKEK